MQPRIGTTLDAPTATFNDTGTETPYSGLGVEYDQQLVINTAIVEIESGGTPQTATDATIYCRIFCAVNSDYRQSVERDAAALTLANYYLRVRRPHGLTRSARRLPV
jgi:hypothetical protein